MRYSKKIGLFLGVLVCLSMLMGMVSGCSPSETSGTNSTTSTTTQPTEKIKLTLMFAWPSDVYAAKEEELVSFDIQLNNTSKDEIGEISQTFESMASQLNETIHEVYISKIKQREAEILALESQINPHFLYNTLDSIRWQAVSQKAYDVGEQIEVLAEMFRHVLSKGKEHVTVSQEITYLENYMFIQSKKYGNRIKMNITVDPELMEEMVPKMLIQPLVENSIVHGLEEAVSGGVIDVNICRNEDTMVITVADNGLGTDDVQINAKLIEASRRGEVLALKNIDDRIKILIN